jgi:hypothetical protein
MTVARKVVRYGLDSMGMQEVRWDKGGAVKEGIILFCGENSMGGACGTYGREESIIHVLDGKPEGKK